MKGVSGDLGQRRGEAVPVLERALHAGHDLGDRHAAFPRAIDHGRLTVA